MQMTGYSTTLSKHDSMEAAEDALESFIADLEEAGVQVVEYDNAD